VGKVLRRDAKQRQEGHDVLRKKRPVIRASKLDPFMGRIEEVLEEYEDATGQRVFEILREKGYSGGISILRDRLRKVRPKPKRKPIIRFETEPGQQGQMDWSPYTIKTRRAGILKVLCFSYVLGFSRRHYIDFTLRRDFFTLIRRHQAAFEHFKGVPEQCLYDGEKTVIIRWEARKPIFNPAFLQFITHYHCRPVACGPGRPETKGKVEAPFLFVENNLLNARTFTDLEDLRNTARWWLANRSDTHEHDTTGKPPLELFLAEEAHMLQAIPTHHYDSSEVGFRVGRLDGFVEWDSNIYSMPYEYVGEILTVRATETEIVVYTPEVKEIARHERLPRAAHDKSELTEHRVGSKAVRYGLEPVRETFLCLGDGAEVFLRGLEQNYPRYCGYHARRILLLKETYSSDDIHRALLHAIRYQAWDVTAVERILTARARPRTLESTVRQRASEHLRAMLPHVTQRSLSEYNDLLHSSADDNNESTQEIANDDLKEEQDPQDP